MSQARIVLPDSDEESPRAGLLSSWTPPREAPSTRGRRSLSLGQQSRSTAFRDRAINNIEKLSRRVTAIWNKMTLLQRVLAVIAIVVLDVAVVLFVIYNEKIFHWLEPFAEKWKHTTGGWTILWALIFIAAFPPMIGYSTCGTTAGFVYGVWEGWLILATATIAGSFCAFLVSRTVLRKHVERMVAHDKRFAAMSLILKHDGVKLLAMIRFCPLPYSLSNGALSTFPTIHPANFALATAMVTPKLLIHAFIGSRLAVIARTGEEMSLGDKAINYSSIVVGGLVGTGVGIYIYRKTMARAKELEAEEANSIRDEARRTGHTPRRFNDDPEAQAAVDTLARDDDAIEYFDESPNETSGLPHYHDELTDDEDVFGKGDGDDDGAIDNITLHRQKR